MRYKTILALFLATLGTGAWGQQADPVKMANDVGFVGCDSLIASTFENVMDASERMFTINYMRDTADTNISLFVTFGKPGDTVWKSGSFHKADGQCYVQIRSMVNEVGNCAGILSKDEHFKYTDDSAGALWAQNSGGVKKILMQSGNSCTQIYSLGQRARATE